MLKGFKQFLLRGNVVDMAVGIVVGAAFGGVVTGFVKDLLTPFIAALVKQPDFSALTFTINGSKFLYGGFINALFSFLIIAAAVYFFVVLPIINSELSSLESSLPGGMGRMAEVAEAFHKLGLSPEMAVKFVPVMTKFVESKGGASTASLLEKALK